MGAVSDSPSIVTMAVSVAVREIFSVKARRDFEQTQTHISRSGHSLTLNISKMAADTAIVTMEGE